MTLISALPTPPPPTEAAMAAAKAFLLAKTGWGTTTNFAIITNDGVVEERRNGACHAGILSPKTVDGARAVVATEIGWQRRSPNPNASYGARTPDRTIIEPFLRWFLYDSWLGRFILNRDDFEFCRDHGIIVSADMNVALMQCIMITSRHFYEVSDQAFLKWTELTSNGTHPTLAYIMCFLTYYSYMTPPETQAVQLISGHRAHMMPSITGFQKWLDHDLGTLYNKTKISPTYGAKPIEVNLEDSKFHYRNFRYYNGGLLFFQDNSVYSYLFQELFQDKEFVERLREFRTGGKSKEMYRPPNPFDKKAQAAVLAANQMNYLEWFAVATPYLNERYFSEGTLPVEEKVLNYA